MKIGIIKKSIWAIIIGIVLFIWFGILYKLYIPRVAAFGCFDDCFNYGAGFFLTKGKTLYSQIFFNHQPFAAYLSAFIQQLFHPQNIFELLLRHRQVSWGIGLFCTFLFTLRFGIKGLLFSLLYELTKWYIFGDRFLAEAIIVYPLIYLSGLVWEIQQKRRIYLFDFIVAAFYTWLIIFFREPYIPIALLLYGYIVTHTKRIGSRHSVILFILLGIITLLLFPIREYFFNVVTVTQQTVFSDAIKQSPIMARFVTMLLYPIQILFTYHRSFFWQTLQYLTILFSISVILFSLQKKSWRWLISWICILTLANIRSVPVGSVFYGAFQLLPWYAIFLFLLSSLVVELSQYKKIYGYFLCFGIGTIVVFYVHSPNVFWKEHISSHAELLTNYAIEMQMGNTVASLSKPTDTLFLDGWGELIFWQANRISPYPYSWYTSVMPLIDKYNTARLNLFKTTPPDFYFGACPKDTNPYRVMPEQQLRQYTRLIADGKPSCLWVRTIKLPEITDEQWKKAKEQLIEKPTIMPLDLPEEH